MRGPALIEVEGERGVEGGRVAGAWGEYGRGGGFTEVGEDPALEMAAQLALEVGRDGIALGIDLPALRWTKSRD